MSGLSFNTPKAPGFKDTGTKPKAPAPPLAAVSPTQIVQDTPEQSPLNQTEFLSAQSQVIIPFYFSFLFLHATKVRSCSSVSLFYSHIDHSSLYLWPV